MVIIWVLLFGSFAFCFPPSEKLCKNQGIQSYYLVTQQDCLCSFISVADYTCYIFFLKKLIFPWIYKLTLRLWICFIVCLFVLNLLAGSESLLLGVSVILLVGTKNHTRSEGVLTLEANIISNTTEYSINVKKQDILNKTSSRDCRRKNCGRKIPIIVWWTWLV